MKDKKYPQYEEKDDGMVSEPAEAFAYRYAVTETDELDDRVPLAGPANIDEALADIKQSEMDFASGRAFLWEEVRQTIEDRIRSYAN